VDSGTLGLFFADGAAPNRVSALTLTSKAGANRERHRGETTVTADTRAVALKLELEPGVRSVEVSARRPDGGADILFFGKDFSSEWPTPFIFRQPVRIRRGTVLSITAYGGLAKATLIRY
jgi:hypothetical protein